MRVSLTIVFLIAFGVPLHAESLLEKIGDGAESATGALSKGLKSVGKTIEKGGDAIEDNIDSTGELFGEDETPEQTRAKLDIMESQIVTRLLNENEQAREIYDASAGYAAFDMRRVTVFPLTGGLGRGVAVSKDGSNRSYMMMGTGGVGAAFGIGGFQSQFVIMFETPADFSRFVEAGYEAEADAGYMKGEDRAAENVKFTQGRSFFVLDKKGWRVNANASGTRYWPDTDLN